MPSFTEAAVTLGTVAFRLCPASENVFTYPAIYPFALVNKILAAFAGLAGFRYTDSLRDAAHFVPSSGTTHAGGSYFGLVVNSTIAKTGQHGLGQVQGWSDEKRATSIWNLEKMRHGRPWALIH